VVLEKWEDFTGGRDGDIVEEQLLVEVDEK